jgi:hypothetical protein
MRSCQEHSDREGLKQQSLAKTMHVNHKHYVLPGTSLSPPALLQSKGAHTCGQITMCQQLHNMSESYDFQMRQVLLPIRWKDCDCNIIYGCTLKMNPGWSPTSHGQYEICQLSMKYTGEVLFLLLHEFMFEWGWAANLYRISGWTCNSSFQAPKI